MNTMGRRDGAELHGDVVLVDHFAEDVGATNLARRGRTRGRRGRQHGRFELNAAMRAVFVVMPDVVAKDCFEMSLTECYRRNSLTTTVA
jgi:hypothetical protein